MDTQSTDARLGALERAVRTQRRVIVALATLCGVVLIAPGFRAQQAGEALRARSLVIEDANGRARILLGAPLPGQGTGMSRIGMRINDENGFERFGANLFEDGSMVLGLDAPRGKGDDRNRERINLIADGEGGSAMNWKDRRTGVVARMYLDTSNQVWLQFSDYTQNPPVQRRLGLSGDERPR